MRKMTHLGLAGFLLMFALLALPVAVLAAPEVAVSPSSGPRGTTIGVRANGLNAHTSYLVQLVSGTGNINTVRVFETIATSDASGTSGRPSSWIRRRGAYTVRIVTRDGTMLATTPFTVAAGDSSREQCRGDRLLRGRALPGILGGGTASTWATQASPTASRWRSSATRSAPCWSSGWRTATRTGCSTSSACGWSTTRERGTLRRPAGAVRAPHPPGRPAGRSPGWRDLLLRDGAQRQRPVHGLLGG